MSHSLTDSFADAARDHEPRHQRPHVQHTYSRSQLGLDEQVRETISNPGAVKINVTGAFIVAGDDKSKDGAWNEHNDHDTQGVRFETKDIRLPHHTDVVSHVAVDVRGPPSHPHCELLLTDCLRRCRLAGRLRNSSTSQRKFCHPTMVVGSISSASRQSVLTCVSASSKLLKTTN